MGEAIRVVLSDVVQQEINVISRREGLPPSRIINEAVKEYIFAHQFRLLRDRMSKGQDDLSDEAIFERVS